MADPQWLRDNAEELNIANADILREFADDYEQLQAENKQPCSTCEDGCICQQCGKTYEIDLNIPDYWWEKIKPKGKPGGLLCPACIIQKLKSYKEVTCLYLKVEVATDCQEQPCKPTAAEMKLRQLVAEAKEEPSGEISMKIYKGQPCKTLTIKKAD